MNNNAIVAKVAACALLALPALSNADSSFDGSVELQQRLFLDDAVADDLNRSQPSVRLQADYYRDWNQGDDQLLVEPFVRIDADDDERTHVDLRQFLFTHRTTDTEFSIGLGRVFWGVTESQHLVDIVNQTDLVENIDGEDKLGQPMARFTYYTDIGTFDTFLLPYFRTRTFPGIDGRLHGGLIVSNDNEVYESSSGASHLDYALRYSNTFGAWGIGVSWFDGTSREPDLFRLADIEKGTTTPYYPQIEQLGADVQLTTDAWLFKLEAIQRNFDDTLYQDFAAATIGAEYTLVGVFGSSYDLGLLTEYSWDERREESPSGFQNDLFVGARLALNDISDSEVLLGVSRDLDNSDSQAVFVEAATRFANAITLNIELRVFNSDTPSDPLFRFKDDSFIQIGVEYFFD